MYQVAAKYRLECYHDLSLKQLMRIRTDIRLQPSGCIITHVVVAM